MERELWNALCRIAERLYNRSSRACYGDDVICGVLRWAVVQDRPVRWACDAENWPSALVRRALPSQPTMSRRLRTAEIARLLDEVERTLAALYVVAGPRVLAVDGKALPVGNPSKDRDATWGPASRSFAKGYKLHVVWGTEPLPVAWALAPLNVSERRVAAKLLAELPGEGYVLGDKFFDANHLYEAAASSGYQLLAAQQQPGRALGHRRHSPHRLRGLELLNTTFGRRLYRQRCRVEHQFAKLNNFIGGLGPLPFWVRRFHRVKLWVHSKLLINAVHQLTIKKRFAGG